MPSYIRAATGETVSPSIATFSDGSLRPGFTSVIGDGERLHFHIGFRDAMPGAQPAFSNDSALDRQAVEDARRAWLSDKATAYRTCRTITPAHGTGHGTSTSPPRQAQMQNHSAIRAARDAWLAEKANAFCNTN